MGTDSSDGVVDIVRQALSDAGVEGLSREELRGLADGADGSYTVGDGR